MYFVFTRMPGESYRRRLGSLLLCLCDVFRALITSLVCSFCTSALGLVLFQIYADRRSTVMQERHEAALDGFIPSPAFIQHAVLTLQCSWNDCYHNLR